MDVRFHCTARLRRSGKKSKHGVHHCCSELKKVLALNPNYGPVIPGHNALRKMRVHVPQFNIGKSGGYRLIYCAEIIDHAMHVIFWKYISRAMLGIW